MSVPLIHPVDGERSSALEQALIIKSLQADEFLL
jgi:hypothetical protein